MKNLKVTALLAGALASGLVLGGIGVATAAMNSGAPTTAQTRYGSMATTPTTDPSSGDTTMPAAPPSGDTTPSMSPTDTPRPPMPPQAMGNAYGRVTPHPHTGLHRDTSRTVSPAAMKTASQPIAHTGPTTPGATGSGGTGSMMSR